MKKEVIKQKAMFIKEYGDILYLTRDHKINYENDTIEEKLLSILLSNKPLTQCLKYQELKKYILSIDKTSLKKEQGENYPLKTLFSAARYINSINDKDKVAEKLRNKLRLYSKYFDNHIKNNDEILIDLPKVKTIKK